MENKRLLLFDGNALIHRAYHAMPPLTLKKTAEDVGAVYGFMSMFLKTMSSYMPQYVAFAFDKKGPTFRNELYTDYKANRPKAADDLVSQIIRARRLVEESGIAFYEADGFEADDVIATISEQAASHGIKTLIVTGDADAMQLVGEFTSVLYPSKGNSFAELKEFTPEQVKEKYGVYPHHIADLKALSGDSSDNIPGVTGIGPKTAISLIETFGNVENICANVDKIEQKRARELMSAGCPNAVLYKELCLSRKDVPIEIDFENMRAGRINAEQIQQNIQDLEFNSLLPRVNAIAQLYQNGEKQDIVSLAQVSGESGQYVLVETHEQLLRLAENMENSKEFALDTETDGLDSINDHIVGISVSFSPQQGYYVHLPKGLPRLNSQASLFDFENAQQNDGQNLTLEEIHNALNPVLDKSKIYAHNAKFDMHALKHGGFAVPECVFDTMLAAYILGEQALGLKSLALSKLGHVMTNISEIIGKGKNARTMADVAASEICDYACADADFTYRLKEIFAPEIAEEEGLRRVFYDIEMPLLPILYDMEEVGILLDSKQLNEMSKKFESELNDTTKAIFDIVGHTFNISSPQQLATVLYDELGLPVLKRTATGRSTDAAVLEELSSEHKIIALILKYRNIAKLKSTYVDALPKMVSPLDGRLHTHFNQTGTSTGRISSSDPNLQNIPVREDGGKEIRNAFVAKEGCLLLSADYSQIDLRALAHLSADSNLINAFMNDEDIHSATASLLYGVSIEELTKDMRRLAKTVNFGVMYGMSGFGLERATELTREEADRFIKTYFEKYPAVSAYFAQTKEDARRKGYVQTVFGRRRYIADINSSNRNVREGAERAAINMPVQGTSADIIKIAMINIFKALNEGGYQSRMLLQVHDELILECPENEIEAVTTLVKEHMTNAAKLRVPLKVDTKVGKNWGEMK